MAFGSIELTTISRAQEYSAIKQNEDNKSMVDQTNFGQQMQKNVEQRVHEVHNSDNADWHEKNPDAKEKGNGEYHGDGGQHRRKQQPREQMVIKGQGGFDVRV